MLPLSLPGVGGAGSGGISGKMEDKLSLAADQKVNTDSVLRGGGSGGRGLFLNINRGGSLNASGQGSGTGDTTGLPWFWIALAAGAALVGWFLYKRSA